jgi:hypothetical protein
MSDLNRVFAHHLRLYAEHAGRQALIDASNVETDRHQLIRLAKRRYHDNLDRFSQSFPDCWRAIGHPFRAAARRSMRGGRP